MTAIPASIRHKNPSAMGRGASAKFFGASANTRLSDGNTITTFPTSVDGASAQMHLLWSPAYRGLSVWDALHKWGDGATLEKRGKVYEARQRTGGYVAAIEQRSRFKRGDIITQAMMENAALAIEFCKAQAWHEAGQEYPMSDAQWVEAHEQFMVVIGGAKPDLDRVAPVPQTAPLELAKTHLGETRIPGPGTNAFIEGLFVEVGSKIRGDDESFCAVGVGAMLNRTGYAYVPAPQGQMARSYLNYGHALDEPEEGCIVVQWRNGQNSIWGHVEFVESWTATHLTVLGFNRGGAVVRTTIPRLKSNGGRVLGYRRPVRAERTATEVVRDPTVQQPLIGLFGALAALIWNIWDGITSLAGVVGSAIGLLPDAASQVSSTVAAGREITDAAGMPWPAQFGLFITVCALIFIAYREWTRRRQNSGEVTRPPYETDESYDDSEADQIEASHSIDAMTHAARDLVTGHEWLAAGAEIRRNSERRKAPAKKRKPAKKALARKAAKKPAKRSAA